MAICEDAPCCGCCGPSLYGSEVTDYYDESDYYDRPYFEPEADPEDCDHDGTETRDGTNWFCSWCDTPVDAPEGEFVWAF